MGREEINRVCPVCKGSFPRRVAVCPVDGARLALESGAELARIKPSPSGAPPASTQDSPVCRRKRVESQVREAGTVIGSYRLIDVLGKGGMGVVYLAEHMRLGRRVALKQLRSRYTGNPTAVRRFFAEAQAVNRIRHPNIVQITDLVVGETGQDETYYIMELLTGRTLAERLKQGPLPLAELLPLATTVCDALAAIHRAGIIHRDLKPENIFLARQQEDGKETVKLLDFGLVKLADPPPNEPVPETNPDTLVGTPEYMSPEQIRGVNPADNRSDLYSLGVILYELLTGVRPVVAPTYGELLVRVVSARPTPPSKLLDDQKSIPPRLEALLLRLLEKEPDARPQTTDEVLIDLRAITGEATGMASTGKMRALRPPRVSRRVALLLGGLAVVGLAVVLLLPRGDDATIRAMKGTRRSGTPIAELAQLWGDVSHRESSKQSWHPGDRGLKLFYHDSVRTGRGARARVAFDRGDRLNIDELTTVVIELPDRPVKGEAPLLARVLQGTVRAEARPGVPLRFTDAHGRTTEVRARGNRPVEVRIRADGKGATEVSVLKGSGQLRSGGQSRDLEAGQLVDLKQGKLGQTLRLPPYPQLLSPGVDVRLPPAAAIAVTWSPVERAVRYRIQISNFVAFDETLVDQQVAIASFRFERPQPGTLVWRVASIDAAGHEGEFGFARRFVVDRSLARPGDAGVSDETMLSPANGTVVEYGATPVPVQLRWRHQAGQRYRVVVAKSRGLQRHVVRRRQVTGGAVTLEKLPPGVYYWGVYRQEPGGKATALFERSRRFVIIQRTRPKVHVPTVEWR